MVINKNFITWSTCDPVKVKFSFNSFWLFSSKTEVKFCHLQCTRLSYFRKILVQSCCKRELCWEMEENI